MFIPPEREFISALFLVFRSLGVSSLSTNTNSMSLAFGCGLSNIDKLMPNNAHMSKISHIAPITAGCNIADIIRHFFNDIVSSLSSLVTAGIKNSSNFEFSALRFWFSV